MSRSPSAHANTAVDINSPLALAAALLLGVIGPEVFIVQPGFVQGLVAHYGFSEQQAGYVASAEMWGLAITTLMMSWVASRMDWRKLLFVSTLLPSLLVFIFLFFLPITLMLIFIVVLVVATVVTASGGERRAGFARRAGCAPAPGRAARFDPSSGTA